MSLEIKKQYSLKSLNSWKVGGEAEYFCAPRNLAECKEAQAFAAKEQIPLHYLGLGSNVLISDRGVKGLVVHSRRLTGIESKIEVQKHRLELTCWAGSFKTEALREFLQHGLSPALMLAGIPGDIGGGVVMNAGVSENYQPREFREIVDFVEVLRDGQLHRFENSDLQWSYRHCDGWQPGMIVRVGLSWSLNDRDDNLREKVREARLRRSSRQPLELPSCGSVFVNPLPHHAGQLIESCGLKGYRRGDAQVSEKHANFIVNLGSATATQTHEVIEHVKEQVWQKHQVRLHTEVRYLGEW